MAITGLSCLIDGVANGRGWSISPTAEVTEFSDTGTEGAVGQLDGVEDWTGSFSSYGHTPIVMPGEDFTFTGSIDGTNGATGSAICDSVEITWNQEAKAPIECVVNFSGDGELTLGAAAGTAGAVGLPLLADESCVVNIGSAVHVRTVKLTISRDNKAYHDTEAAGFKKREAGRLSASMSWTRFVDSFASLGAVNTVVTVKLYVTSTLFWEIQSGKYTGPTCDLDREGGELVSATENLAFTALNDAGALGTIKLPGGTVYWPEA
jgi:hypothetical protein